MKITTRREFLKVLTTVAAFPLLSKCPQAKESLTIASHVWSGYEFMFLARREGWLSENSVCLQETVSATDSINALQSGKVQGAGLTLDEVLRVRAAGIPLSCVLVFDVSAGADMVLAKTELSRLQDLTGKRIGYERTSLGALMLYKLLQAAKLDKSAIIPVGIDYDQHLDAWHKNKIDVLISFEPVTSQLLIEGAYKIFDSRKIPDTIFDVLAVKSEVMNIQGSNIKSLVAAHFRVHEHFYHNPYDACYKMAERMKLSANEVLNSFRGLDLPNEQANLKYLTPQYSRLLTAANTLSAIMLESGTLKQPDNLNNLISTEFLPEHQ